MTAGGRAQRQRFHQGSCWERLEESRTNFEACAGYWSGQGHDGVCAYAAGDGSDRLSMPAATSTQRAAKQLIPRNVSSREQELEWPQREQPESCTPRGEKRRRGYAR